MTGPTPLDRSATFYVAGHAGLAGSAVWRHLEREGFETLVGRTSRELDLRDREAVLEFFAATRPRYVILAAARVGGIGANSRYPVEFLSENLRIQVNVLDAAHEVGVERLLFVGSSCIYPRLAPQPIREDALFTGPLEPTNEAYALAKIAGVVHVQAMRAEYDRAWVSAMPTNLYGPGDNYDPSSSHVLAAMIRRFDQAVREGHHQVTNWGTGTPMREFLHVDDMARALLFLMENYAGPVPVNVGSGDEVTVAELARLVARATGFEGDVVWDSTKPDGMPRKALDSSFIHSLGWSAQVRLDDGIREAVADFRQLGG